MAVIREKQQFRNQRIGVVRMDTGAEDYFKTIANASDQLAQIAFKEAGVQAKQKGAETAQSVKATRLRTINPETGKPEAYTAPEGFGTVAQAAYEEVLDRRFVNDIDQQIKNRGRELYLKYQNDPHGVEKYDTAMTDFVAQMSEPKNNTGILNDRFKNLIKETGAAFIASTKFNLMSKRAAIVADQLRLGLDDAALNTQGQIQDVIKAGQGNNIEYESGDVVSDNTVDLMLKTAIDEQDAGLEAGILTVPQHKKNVDGLYAAVPKGQLSALLNYNSVYLDNNNKAVAMDSEVALRIESAIDSGIVPDDTPDSLKPVVQSIIDSEGYNRKTSELKTIANQLRVGLQNREKDVKDATQFQIAVERNQNPNQKVDPADQTNKLATDFIIASLINDGTDGIKIDVTNPKNLNMVPYFTSADSTKSDAVWKKQFMVNGVISEGLEQSFKRAFRLDSMTGEELKNTLNNYNYLSKAFIGGHIINKTLDTTLSNEQNAFLRTLNNMTVVGGVTDIVSFAASLKENMQNEPFVNSRVKEVLGADQKQNEKQSANDLLNSVLTPRFGTDYKMIETVKPYAKYLIMSGVGKDGVEKALLEMFETSYVETEAVVDRHNPNLERSMYSEKRILPDQKERFVFYKNVTELVQKLSGNNKLLIREKSLGIPDSDRIKLVPITANSFEPDMLPLEIVVDVDGEEQQQQLSLPTFQYMAYSISPNGQLKMIPNKETGGPILIGTELAYEDIAAIRKERIQDEIYDSSTRALRKIILNQKIESKLKLGMGKNRFDDQTLERMEKNLKDLEAKKKDQTKEDLLMMGESSLNTLAP